MIDDYLVEIGECSPHRIIFDDRAWRIVVDRAIVTDQKIIEIHFINGNISIFPIPNK